MIVSLDDWPWSSFPFVVGREAPPPWLDVDWLLRQFAPERDEARRAYVEFLLAGRGLLSPVLEARQQLVLWAIALSWNGIAKRAFRSNRRKGQV